VGNILHPREAVDLLNHDGFTVAAIDTPHRVKQKNQKSPERNELKTSLGEFIVSRGLMTA